MLNTRLFVCLIILSVLFLVTHLNANNVQVLSIRQVDAQKISVRLKWYHAWNLADGRHDAIWGVVKWKQQPTNNNMPFCFHIPIASDQPLQAQKPLQAFASKDGVGFWVKMEQLGEQNISESEIQIPLQHPIPENATSIQVHLLEMVYIPTKNFWLGDAVCNNSFMSGKKTPLEITSENSIFLGDCDTCLSAAVPMPPEGNIPAEYPKGYKGFYIMKYEVSQAQYVVFLNALPYAHQKKYIVFAPHSPNGTFVMSSTGQYMNRNGIVIVSSGNESEGRPAVFGLNADSANPPNASTDGGDRACNFLNWDDLAGYLDWIGLRPLTELEFEKAGSGSTGKPIPPHSFAWATPNIIDANTVIDDGTVLESITEIANDTAGIASHGYSGPQGPLRNGFSASSVSNRLQAGASFDGVMEISGNLWELCVNTRLDGLQYAGTHGDGILDESGGASKGVFPALSGACYRGGGWLSGVFANFRDLAVSDRFYAHLIPEIRRPTSGGRGVRSL